MLANSPNVHERVMEALVTLTPYCDMGGVEGTKLKGVMGKVKQRWKGVEEEYRKELEGLAEKVMKA